MWRQFSNEKEFEARFEESTSSPLLLFKHSPRCGISFDIKSKVDIKLEQLSQKYDCYLIDVISERLLSQHIAKEIGVMHQSPQLIIFDQGNVLYHSSHYGINLTQVMNLETQN